MRGEDAFIMQFRNYYDVLGVARDATADEIKKAFRKLARKYHPDISKEPEAERHMQEVNEANAVLSDPEKRAAYDQLGNTYRPGEEFHPPPDWDAGFEFSAEGFSPGAEGSGFSDFFEQIFGRAGGYSQGAAGRASYRGQGEDHRARIYLELDDAYSGATRQITLRAPKLDGQGRVTLQTRTLNVKIPRGVKEGQVIRLAGQGTPGAVGTRVGDLLLEVHFKPHPRFRVDGRDLYLSLPVAPWEAALGAVVAVDLPGGSVKVRIPEGASSGKLLRVRGKGIPGEPPGDLLLTLEIALPPADTPKARALYEQMASDLAFNPRQSR